jgi:hypothetical protein
VNVVRSLWVLVQSDPVFMQRVNGWLSVFLAEERTVDPAD